MLTRRHLIPSALLFAACPTPSTMTDAGPDGGGDPCLDYDAGPQDAGVRCSCSSNFSDGMWYSEQCCDQDIGNPCPICCGNPRDADGGRQYYPDGGPPICYC